MPVTIIPGTMKYKKNGTFNPLDCVKGDSGLSPAIAITDITGGHRVTITDETGPHSFDVMNGSDATAPVQDVQVNGTSALDAQGVANIPYATASEYGLIKRGRGLFVDNTTGALVVDFGDSGQIKQGTNTNAVMSIFKQHESAFYGLAKVAGSDLANETVTLGQYPASARTAIKRMFGINDEWELIKDYTVAQNSDEVVINTDENGDPFYLSSLFVQVMLKPPITGSTDYVLANLYCLNSQYGTEYIGAPTNKFRSTTGDTYMEYKSEYIAGIWATLGRSAAGYSNTTALEESTSAPGKNGCVGFRLSKYTETSSQIPQGTTIKIYGKRWID